MGSQLAPERFMDRTAIVTGGAQGIGLAVTERIAREGGRVFIADFNAEVGQASAERLRDEGLDVNFEQVNVTDDESIHNMVGRVADKTEGQIDIAILNAGITGNERTLLKSDAAEMRRVLAVNLMGPIVCAKEIAPFMVPRNYGRIVVASSVVARFGNVGQPGYSASKGGVESFVYTEAKELGRKGVTVNAIAPGFTRTAMMDVVPDANLEAIAKATPAQRLGRVEDIAAAYAFLASEEAGFINGQVLGVDGGLHL